jgi:hypothetical protein
VKLNVTYRGLRTEKTVLVTVDNAELPSRTDLRNHSPTGFEWGYEGSGPAQLALAILCDFLQDDQKALEYYQEFKRDIISPIGGQTWTLHSDSITEWYRRKLRENRDNAGKGPVY